MVTTIKYNFSTLGGGSNDLFTNGINEVVNATSSLWGYSILILIFVVSFFVMNNRTNDISKSLISSVHVVFIISLLMYYWGVVAGFVLIHSISLLFIIVIESVSVAAIYYNRMQKDN